MNRVTYWIKAGCVAIDAVAVALCATPAGSIPWGAGLTVIGAATILHAAVLAFEGFLAANPPPA